MPKVPHAENFTFLRCVDKHAGMMVGPIFPILKTEFDDKLMRFRDRDLEHDICGCEKCKNKKWWEKYLI